MGKRQPNSPWGNFSMQYPEKMSKIDREQYAIIKQCLARKVQLARLRAGFDALAMVSAIQGIMASGDYSRASIACDVLRKKFTAEW